MPKQEKKQNEEQLQQMYGQLQYIDSQLSELDKESKIIGQKKEEFSKLNSELDKLNKTKKSAKAFANIGAGIFAQAKISNAKEFLVNVGANTYVKKSLKDVQSLLKKQASELEKVEGQVQQNMQMLSMQAQIIQAEMQKSLNL
ncbi:prefoldin subunit alpha [Candidatus Woesearchaeota archaeon]|jgi:prefoldin alpha subunit|nr:prefoldin subunit alpha [Candidatus Woesearchaeota archaeon]MBT4114076.1 prefoldin subunit alpha [Candidatus Woesearchaeota archaeon]MBT4248517.1 prefoldin subunit alpha [Candidatus Woesearchaeota archaeon]